MLYDAGNIPLSERRAMTNKEKQVLAQEHFDHWYNSSKGFLRASKSCLKEDDLNISVFNLHQATERTYNAVTLVFTGYKPNTHNLSKLRRYCRNHSAELFAVFPRDTVQEKHLFDLLKRAYVDARYKKDYVITADELQTLINRVEKLQNIVEEICGRKIEKIDKD